MAMKMEQVLRQAVSLAQSPQLQMAIKLLNMTRAELIEQVLEEIKENPLLEDVSAAEPYCDDATHHIETSDGTGEPLAPPGTKEQTDDGREVTLDAQPADEIDWATFLEDSMSVPMSGTLHGSVPDGQPQDFRPDVYVQKVGDKYFVAPNDNSLPKLRISRSYLDAVKDKDNKATRDYVQERLRSAKWLIDSIQLRQRTIVKVTESILKFQRDFFEHGPSHLRPLILRDVANDVGMHESTILQATENKYVHTPHGLYELKYFFHTFPGQGRNPEESSSDAVKESIKRLISIESGKSPYTDQQLAELLLCLRGVEISRRTVTTYRDELGILPSQQRKSWSESLRFHKLGGEQPDSLSFTITLEGSESLTDSFQAQVRTLLRNLAQDPSLRITNIRSGSIIIEIEGSEEGYDRILAAIRSALFREIRGHRIQSIKIVRGAVCAMNAEPPKPSTPAGVRQQGRVLSCSELRKMIAGILVTDAMFDAFVLDHFEPVKKQFTNGMERMQKETLLLELADRSQIVAALSSCYPHEWSRVERM